MRAKIKYAIFVKEDILESVNWYNRSQKDLGFRFLWREFHCLLLFNPNLI